MIWNGAKVLTEDLCEYFNIQEYIYGKSIIEFGAAAGLPAIIALLQDGSRMRLCE